MKHTNQVEWHAASNIACLGSNSPRDFLENKMQSTASGGTITLCAKFLKAIEHNVVGMMKTAASAKRYPSRFDSTQEKRTRRAFGAMMSGDEQVGMKRLLVRQERFFATVP